MSADLEQPYRGAFVGNTHYFAVRVYIEDTDIGGVVYHAKYLGFLERARSDMLRSVGIDQRTAIENGTGVYAVAELQIKYLKPARLDDDLVIATNLSEVRAASCRIRQQITRRNEMIAQATVTAAFLGPGGRPRRQPAEWAEKFSSLLSPISEGP
ncbi:MAG TPA: YbgC/FadM family acyl-CoA thioesterase [Verrucomicrobiae bacterium]|jgi:acyl-CoA thioester hydrolase|nr:YbgC/FadM family acyl-CoA thioesterase [Verrucomicrobiae bacterium]